MVCSGSVDRSCDLCGTVDAKWESVCSRCLGDSFVLFYSSCVTFLFLTPESGFFGWLFRSRWTSPVKSRVRISSGLTHVLHPAVEKNVEMTNESP